MLGLPYNPLMDLLDAHQRPLRNLRLSVTDRCNLRCQYCMPEESYAWLPKEGILRFTEISRLVDVFGSLGVRKVRLTGGEPLLRRDLAVLIEMLAKKEWLSELAMTTNGLLLEDAATRLRDAGLGRVTVSLDTLRADRFERLSRRDGLHRTLAGIDAAIDVGFEGIKIDTVLMRGENDDEIDDLLAFGRDRGVEVRFIEYMDVGGATNWSMKQVVPRDELLERVARSFGAVAPIEPADDLERSAPADRFRLGDGTTFGVISSTTQPFCGACDRSRLTADGSWFLCLYARVGLDLKKPLRAGASDDELRARIRRAWRHRDDRGAEDRLAVERRGALADKDTLRDDPLLEMHTRGG